MFAGARAKPRRERERGRERERESSHSQQEARVLAEFCKHFKMPFRDMGLLKLALTHRSYLSVTGQGPRESNERLEFLGDSVLGLVTSEALYRRHPDEHEGQLTKTKSLLVSKAILSRRALKMGLGRFVLMSHSEVESGGRQRLSILADAFESVLGAIYLDQGFEVSRQFIHTHLLSESDAIVADKRHTNYKSHLQEYVQSTFRTHPVYRIRSEYGPDHSKHFMVEVMIGKRTLGDGRGHNKKEAEQAAARDALEKVARVRTSAREEQEQDDDDDILPEPRGVGAPMEPGDDREGRSRRRGRRGGRGRRAGLEGASTTDAPAVRRNAGGFPADGEDDRLESETRTAAIPEAEPRHVAASEQGYEEDPDDADLEELDDSGVIDDEDVDEVEELDDDSLESDDEEGDDDDEDDDDDDDDEDEDPAPHPVAAPAPAQVQAVVPVTPAARVAPVPLAYGRNVRRGPARPPAVTTPVPSTAVGASVESAGATTPHEDLHVDVYGHDESKQVVPLVEVEVVAPSAPAAPAEVAEDPKELARIEEMERAMENFGRRRSGGSGRSGRRR